MSVCSEPANLSIYQSSAENCFLKMSPTVPQSSNVVGSEQSSIEMKTVSSSSLQTKRPSTLLLDCYCVENVSRQLIHNKDENQTLEKPSHPRHPKTLFRSNSSCLHKRQSTFVPTATTSSSNKFKLSDELDQIFVISSNHSNDFDDEKYDSIDVIDERRMKNMPKSDRARLYKSNTFICEEYYTNKQLANVIEKDTIENKESK